VGIHVYSAQYTQEIDINAHKRNDPTVFQERTFYGRILGFLAVDIPLISFEQIVLSPRTHILANVSPIKLEKKRNRLGMPAYKGDNLGPARLIDVSCIQCVIGRVKDREFWTIIDRGDMSYLVESYTDSPTHTED
jgi:hypothetical protein